MNKPKRYVDDPWLARITPDLVEGLRTRFKPIDITPGTPIEEIMHNSGSLKVIALMQAELDKRVND